MQKFMMNKIKFLNDTRMSTLCYSPFPTMRTTDMVPLDMAHVLELNLDVPSGEADLGLLHYSVGNM